MQIWRSNIGLIVRPGEVGDATIPQLSVPAVEPTLFPQYQLFTLIYTKYRACSWVYACTGAQTTLCLKKKHPRRF